MIDLLNILALGVLSGFASFMFSLYVWNIYSVIVKVRKHEL